MPNPSSGSFFPPPSSPASSPLNSKAGASIPAHVAIKEQGHASSSLDARGPWSSFWLLLLVGRFLRRLFRGLLFHRRFRLPEIRISLHPIIGNVAHPRIERE